MATRATGPEAIAGGTGRDWADWLEWLEAIGARDMSHKEIAQRVKAEGGTTGWWAQYVTVVYEQHIGRRVPGQDHTGSFQVSVTRTLAGSMDEAMAQWIAHAGEATAFDGVAVAKGPRQTRTDRWRRWGVTLADGTRVGIAVNEKGPDKALLAATHEKLASQEDLERWRAFWRKYLAEV